MRKLMITEIIGTGHIGDTREESTLLKIGGGRAEKTSERRRCSESVLEVV